MKLRKYRWSRVYESAEEELLALLKAKNLAYERWAAEPGEIFTPTKSSYDKTLWFAEGSAIFESNNKQISMQPGDTLDLPANTVYSIMVGLGGFVFYESQA